jgi:hypothetical protein
MMTSDPAQAAGDKKTSQQGQSSPGPLAPPAIASPNRAMTIVLTVVFVALYVAAIFGVGGTPNDAIVKLLQPIVYVIMGYFFGRLPADATEKSLQANTATLQQEVTKVTSDAGVAKEKQLTAEGKLKHVRAILTTLSADALTGGAGSANALSSTQPTPQDAHRHAIANALSVIEA